MQEYTPRYRLNVTGEHFKLGNEPEPQGSNSAIVTFLGGIP